MNVKEIASELGLEIGQVFRLTEEDWDFKAPANKPRANLIGLAIDRHIKSYLAESGISVPSSQYAEYDFLYKDVYFDIKSFTKSSVSISDRELSFAHDKLAGDKGFVYAVFEQLDSKSFIFRGFISLETLLLEEKIYDSQYSGVYFSLNDGDVRKAMFD